MALSMTRPFKHPRTGVYWLRRRVPEDLQKLLGRKEITRTLGTKNPGEAKAKLAVALAELDAQWANLRLGPRELSEAAAHRLAAPITTEWLHAYSENPSEQKAWDTQIGVEGLWNPSTAARSAGFASTLSYVERMKKYCFERADQVLAEAGFPPDEPGKWHAHENRKRLAYAVSAAIHRACISLEKAGRGEFLEVASFAARPSPLPLPLANFVGLDQLVADWSSEKTLAKKTIYEWTRVIDELKAFLGHDNAAQISSVDLNRWKAKLLEEGRRPKTIRDAKIAPVRAILQWAVNNDRLAINAAARVTLDVKTKLSEKKRGFKEAEAKMVLTAARRQRNPVLRWVPFLGAYTGARVSELCQLRREDVALVEGIWCLRITDEAGSLKTASSERLVPVHSALIAERFIEFAESVASGPLFATLSPNAFGSRGGHGTKMIGRWVRSLGITDEQVSPTHSWRHRFKTLGRSHEIRLDIGDALLGHGRKSVGDSYGEFQVSALKRELEKIPPLDLRE